MDCAAVPRARARCAGDATTSRLGASSASAAAKRSWVDSTRSTDRSTSAQDATAHIEGRRQCPGTLLREGHLDVEPGREGADRVAQAPDEVADDDALEAPLLAQDRRQQLRRLTAPLAVHGVVGAHDGRDPRVHHRPEVRQVDLVQDRLVDRDVDREASVLHAVAGVVLDAGHDVALGARRQRGAERPEQQGVLAVGLLRAAPRRVPEQVDAHAAEEVAALRADLRADGRADALLELRVPGRAAGHRDREGGRAPDDRTAGAVAEAEPWDAEPLDGAGHDRLEVVPLAHHLRHPRPERLVAVEQAEALVGCQLLQQRPGHLVHRLAGSDPHHGCSEGGRRRVRRRHGPTSS
jgi:hypothetical protein